MADEKVLTVPLSKMAAELAEKHELSKKATGEILGDFVDLLVKNLKKGNKVRVTGLGIFQVKKRPARLGRNPLTGEQIKIKASKKLAFRAAKEVKEAI
jgi:DNA-binding protein HU-beta